MNELMLRTKTAIADCESHLKSTNSYGTEIESYLTQHLLVIFCAEIQQEIYKIVDERSDVSNDEGLRVFVRSSGRRTLRSVGKAEIANFLELFGAQAKEKFNSLLDDKDITVYNNAVQNRHDVAHRHGVQISFEEVKDALAAANKILEAVKAAIFVNC
jgi:hypothetical protein